MFLRVKLKIIRFFSKKVCKTFGQYEKRSYLCTRFREATEVKSSDAFFCSLLEQRNSIFDRLRTVQKTSSARIYLYVCAQA